MATNSPMVPTPTNHGMGHEEALYRGVALAQLRILKQQMQLGNLFIGNRRVRLDNGVEILCNVSGIHESIRVILPDQYAAEVEQTEDQLLGFACYPYSGSVVMATVMAGNSPASVLRMNGTFYDYRNNTKTLYEDIALNPAYPLLAPAPDIAKLYTPIKGPSAYQYSTVKNIKFGNMDWKSADNKCVLTWVGPPSRYFAVDDTLASNFGFSAASPEVFYRGKVVATLPKAIVLPDSDYERKPLLSIAGSEIPYVVAGCAINKNSNGDTWLIVACRQHKIEQNSSSIVIYNHFNICAIRFGVTNAEFYHPTKNLDGWKIIYNTSTGVGSIVHNPVFFSGDGSMCVSVDNGALLTWNISADSGSAVLSHTPHSPGKTTITSSISQTGGNIVDVCNFGVDPYESKKTLNVTNSIIQQSSKIIAADFKGNDLIIAKTTFESSVTETFTSTREIRCDAKVQSCPREKSWERVQQDVQNGTSDRSYTLSLQMGNNNMNMVLCSGTGSLSEHNTFSTTEGVTESTEYDISISGFLNAGVGTVFSAGGGTAPLTWSISQGSIDASNGIITAVPDCAYLGKVYTTVSVVDACGKSATLDIVLLTSSAGSWVLKSCDYSVDTYSVSYVDGCQTITQSKNTTCTGFPTITFTEIDGVTKKEYISATGGMDIYTGGSCYCSTAGSKYFGAESGAITSDTTSGPYPAYMTSYHNCYSGYVPDSCPDCVDVTWSVRNVRWANSKYPWKTWEWSCP